MKPAHLTLPMLAGVSMAPENSVEGGEFFAGWWVVEQAREKKEAGRRNSDQSDVYLVVNQLA